MKYSNKHLANTFVYQESKLLKSAIMFRKEILSIVFWTIIAEFEVLLFHTICPRSENGEKLWVQTALYKDVLAHHGVKGSYRIY